MVPVSQATLMRAVAEIERLRDALREIQVVAWSDYEPNDITEHECFLSWRSWLRSIVDPLLQPNAQANPPSCRTGESHE